MPIKFTKIVKEDKPSSIEKESKDMSAPPSPTDANHDSRDSLPNVFENVGGAGSIPREVEFPVLDSPVDESSTPKKRGRPKGSTNKKKGRPSKNTSTPSIITVEQLARQIEGVHAIADLFIPGSRMPNAEAMVLAESVKQVMDAYGIQPDEKIAAVLGLVTTAAIIELPYIQNAKKQLNLGMKRKKSPNIIQRQKIVAPPTTDEIVYGDNLIEMLNEKPKQNNEIPLDNGGIFAHNNTNVAEGDPM